MDVDLDITCDEWQQLNNPEETVLAAAKAALRATGNDDGDLALSVVLSDDETVAELNTTWRNKPRATNVLSFPVGGTPALGAGEPRFIGDIILASGVVIREARDAGKPLATYLAHLVIHGILHLVGYDHDNDISALKMQTAETAAMTMLGLPDPYQEDEPTAAA